MKESELQNKILHQLSAKSIFLFKINTTGLYDSSRGVMRKLSGFSIKGVSDIIGILPGGQFIAIEVKSLEGRLSEHQKIFLNKVEEMGGKAFVINDESQIEEVLDELGME